ncbi:MAG: HAD-IA family hydrolase, partial [Thermodesulfobacteriota bacterium]|nr:HAD-IA family hydrolase [Thermodesulfobacteriota bacterium]
NIDYREVLPFLKPESGLYPLLSTLSAVGINCAVYTNRTTTMDLVLEKFALQQYFHPVVTASTVRAKPHPEGMHKILHTWRAKPREVAYIGDSEVDADTAEASGVPFWSYKDETLKAEMHLFDLWSLRRCLQRAHPEAARGF